MNYSELLQLTKGWGNFVSDRINIWRLRSYCWVNISENGVIQLNQQILDFLNLKIGMKLLSIRSSDIAFTMGATGPLLERADNYEGEIPLY